jgi:hypothetical protein
MNKKIIFMHIPKTGGLSFENLLHRNFPGNKLFRISDYRNPWRNQLENNRDKVKCVSGHFFYNSIKDLPIDTKDAIIFTLLRDPIIRSISYYFHSKHKYSVKEWFESTAYDHYKGNSMTIFLSKNYFYTEKNHSGEPINAENYETALKRLHTINFGFTERFNKTMKYFKKLYPDVFKITDYEYKNRGDWYKEITEKEYDIFVKNNLWDIKLYNYAERLWKDKLKKEIK